MAVITCPATDSKAHDIWNTSCECGCVVDFDDHGNMLIHHQAFDESRVEGWAIIEES